MKLPQPVAWNLQPRLVRVVREELAGPPVSNGGRGCASPGIAVQSSDSLLGAALELVDVYDHVGVGKQRNGIPHKTSALESPSTRRAKWAALCSRGPASSIWVSGHNASITCSRCSVRRRASA